VTKISTEKESLLAVVDTLRYSAYSAGTRVNCMMDPLLTPR